MVKTYICNEKSSSLNTMSHQQNIHYNDSIERIKKSNESFALQSTKYDYYRDNYGTNWVIGYLGKSENDSEWRIWSTLKSPRTADDAKYYIEKLNKSEAIEIFDKIVGTPHNEIIQAFQKNLKMPNLLKSTIKQREYNRQTIKTKMGEVQIPTRKKLGGESKIPTIIESTIKDENFNKAQQRRKK